MKKEFITLIILTFFLSGCSGDTTPSKYIEDYSSDASTATNLRESDAAITDHELQYRTKCDNDGNDLQDEYTLNIDIVDDYIVEIINIDSVNYRIESRLFRLYSESRSLDVEFTYPMVADMENLEVQAKINDYLYNKAYNLLLSYGECVTKLSAYASYEIAWAGEKFLSIKYIGWEFRSGAAYDSDTLYTANIDMRTGENLTLKDFFILDDRFFEAFTSCAIIDDTKYHIFPEAYDYIQRSFTYEQLGVRLNSADINNTVYTTDYASYFTEKTLGISFGTVKALSSYAEIVISYEDLMDNIRLDNDIWFEIMPSLKQC